MSEWNRKYQIDTQENKAFMKKIREDLFRFGRSFPSPGGSSYYLGDDGTPCTECARETWITCRMAYVYSLGTFLKQKDSGMLADCAIRGLGGELRDARHGGWFTGRTAEGQVLPEKQCYTHAFVILAACAATLAQRPGAEELLRYALGYYDLRFWNDEEGLACDSWDTDFTVMNDYRGLNANMHSAEAFLTVADVTGNEEYRVRAEHIINRVLVWASENDWRIPEHFTKDWKPVYDYNIDHPDDQFKPYGATPGHAMEWARLIIQWALSVSHNAKRTGLSSTSESPYAKLAEMGGINFRDTDRYINAAERLYSRAVKDAWNVDGAPGFVYTTDWDGKPVIHDRMHWTLAEAINTSAVLYRTTGKEEYAENYSEFMQYLDEKVLDHVNGSWFHQLDRNNNPARTVWPGKPDVYHAMLATLVPYCEPSLSVGVAVKSWKN